MENWFLQDLVLAKCWQKCWQVLAKVMASGKVLAVASTCQHFCYVLPFHVFSTDTKNFICKMKL